MGDGDSEVSKQEVKSCKEVLRDKTERIEGSSDFPQCKAKANKNSIYEKRIENSK